MILITGCAGYIGSQLCYVLKEKKIHFPKRDFIDIEDLNKLI